MASRNPLQVIVLTFDSEASLRQVIESVLPLEPRILVVDSGSGDATREIAAEMGCRVLEHPFENYSRQRNWAQEQAGLAPDDWVLHLDSDELLSPELATHVAAALRADDPAVDGFLVRRLSHFLGKPIRYGSLNPSWHLRLFRAGKGCCEDRLYDQHFLVDGATARLPGPLIDLQRTTLEKWTAAHNRWSSAEAQEVLTHLSRLAQPDSRQLRGDLRGDLRMKKRWIKNQIWYRTPLLGRCFVFFFYSYVIRLGFLDGKTGLIYHVLQSFWFRFLVDAKIYEAKQNGETASR